MLKVSEILIKVLAEALRWVLLAFRSSRSIRAENDWRDALVVVRPQTLIRWHRAGWKLFGRLESRPGRPPIPAELQALIRRIANENPSWGEERIANELLLKLGILVSPRTVNKYIARRVVIEHQSRRLVHCNVAAHPSAAWTLQQLREAVGFEERYELLERPLASVK